MLVCSDKLKHYSKMLNKKADENSKELANKFEHLQIVCKILCFMQSRKVWLEQMQKEEVVQ